MTTVASFYRRILPSPPAIDFSSPEGKQLFIEAIQGGTMEGFFKLISSFQTQSEPAYCGLASLAMVLNALAIDPGRKWKGPWRWFDESMLDCCETLETVKAKGISFGKVVCLAHCAGAKVQAFRTNQSTLDDFRKYVMSCSSSDDCHIISSYDRETFKQTGTGHFSPIGGYHARRDMVLILDVARFKYPPHWVPLPLLWDAMNTLDEASGYHRGFMLISRLHRPPALLYTLSCKHESWVSISKYLVDDVPVLLSLNDVAVLKDVLSIVFNSLPSKFLDFIKWVAEIRSREGDGQSLSQEEKERLTIKEEILKEVQGIGLYKHVSDYLVSWESCCKATLSLNIENSLPNIAASVCCQGAGVLEGNTGSSDGFYCTETRVNSIQSNGDKAITVVSGKVVNGIAEERVDMIVPAFPGKQNCCDSDLSSCIGVHPATNDVLTVLLLALPPQTWTGIKDQHLLQEIHSLLSVENLSALLQEEILHLRGQFLVLQRCKDDEVEEELGAPLF